MLIYNFKKNLENFTPLERHSIIKNNKVYFDKKLRKIKRYINSLTGFTLIETVVTIAIFSLVLGTLSGFIIYGYRVQGYVLRQSQAIDEAQRGIETMVKEIRRAWSGEDGSYLIGEAKDFEFIFYSDIDRDLETERIRYYVEGTDLIKEIIDSEDFPPQYSSQPKKIFLSHYIRNTPPIFKYLDEKGEELAYPARKKDTKTIKVYLEINVNPVLLPLNFVLESAVRPRNL